MKARVGILVVGIVFLVMAVNSWASIYCWFYIPHLAIGGGYTSYLTIRDPQGIASRTVWVYLYGDDGKALTANVEGIGQVSGSPSFSFTLTASQERSFAITGTILKTGSIQMASDGIGTLNASLRFTTTDSSGNATDVVGILPADADFDWTVAVEKRSATDYTGIAIANPYTQSTTITIDFYKNGSRVPGTTSYTFTLNGLAHFANFVHGIFPSVWDNFTGTGTLRISSTPNNVSVIALRGDGAQYSSLQADVGAQWWNVTYTDSSGAQLCSWSWRFNDGYTFVGYEQNPFNTDKVRLRGVLATDVNFFLAEWLYSNSSSDGTAGQVVFMGTPGKEGSTDVVNGRRIQLKSDGTIISNIAFKATRGTPGSQVVPLIALPQPPGPRR